VEQSTNGKNSKLRILNCAAKLFAEKGYTETSIRKLAAEVGMKGSSLYNHFPSKGAILEHMLEDYSKYNTDVFAKRDIGQILCANPTSEGILACLQLSFPPDKQDYFLKILCVLLQEQLRNPIVHQYMSEHFILRSENNFRNIIGVLKSLNVLRQDTDVDYWMKVVSSLFYSFATRIMLGIGDDNPDFAGKGMVEMLKATFDLMFEKCGVAAP
jgi:AcrR family transcriptional regulator